jgi:hypothetical protein
MTESSERRELFPLSHGVSPGSEGRTSRDRPYYTFLTTPSDIGSEDSAITMWSTYMKEAVEYDKFITDAWREDAKGFLVFVSPRPLVQCGHCIDNVERLVYFLQSWPPFS